MRSPMTYFRKLGQQLSTLKTGSTPLSFLLSLQTATESDIIPMMKDSVLAAEDSFIIGMMSLSVAVYNDRRRHIGVLPVIAHNEITVWNAMLQCTACIHFSMYVHRTNRIWSGMIYKQGNILLPTFTTIDM